MTNIMVGVLVVAAFLIGSLYTKVQYLEKNGGSSVQSATQTAPQAAPPENVGPVKVSIDDDPIMGKKDAKLTIIDFSDYECPFCKRYFDDTFSQIKKEYIDTGKIKYVYRDLPLSFHANAHKEAQAAECAREQGGDAVYYKYHDEIFKRTTSNGTGLALDQLSVIANDLGLNGDALQKCLDSEKYKAEVDKDLADAATVGANGTPTFFIGKSTANGIIEGARIVGAQPFSAFQAEIDKLLQ
jgi:protein-disulfide isomerase